MKKPQPQPQPQVEWTMDGMDTVIVTADDDLTEDEVRAALHFNGRVMAGLGLSLAEACAEPAKASTFAVCTPVHRRRQSESEPTPSQSSCSSLPKFDSSAPGGA